MCEERQRKRARKKEGRKEGRKEERSGQGGSVVLTTEKRKELLRNNLTGSGKLGACASLCLTLLISALSPTPSV